jgi:hypothetical protein
MRLMKLGGVGVSLARVVVSVLLVGLAAPWAVAQNEELQPFDAEKLPIVSLYAPLEDRPLALAARNQIGGNSIVVVFRYAGGAFSRVAYNESPQKMEKPEIAVAAQVALQGDPFKDGQFALGESGRVASPLGDFDFQIVLGQQPIGVDPLLSCAVFQRLISAGMAAVTGYFCDHAETFSMAELGIFFGKLGIRGIGMPE